MTDEAARLDPGHLADDARRIWEAKAAFWDERFGEGNAFHRVLVAPAAERLLALRPGERVLELACGNGAFARQMARLGARVLATDSSETFLERARARTVEHADRIEYRLLDATDEAQIAALGIARFDAAVANMALMDLPTIAPLFAGLARVLEPGGRFVFAIQHPCFNNNDVTFVAEQRLEGGTLVTHHTLRLDRYLDLPAGKGVGMLGEPEPHYYFHRPLHALLADAFSAGFVLDGLEEPAFPPAAPDDTRPSWSWQDFPGIPPVLVGRLRTSGPTH